LTYATLTQQAIKEYIGEPLDVPLSHGKKLRTKSQEHHSNSVDFGDQPHTSGKIRFDPIGRDVREHQFRERDPAKDINPEMKFGLSKFRNHKADASGLKRENQVATVNSSLTRSTTH